MYMSTWYMIYGSLRVDHASTVLYTLEHGSKLVTSLTTAAVHPFLDCHKGGLIKRGHDDLRDSDTRLADLAWGGVNIEPVMIPEDDRSQRPMLQVDWLSRGVWEGNRVAFGHC